MDKEKRYNIIMQHTRQLKQKVGTALSLKECKNIIENTFNDGFEFNTKQVNDANTSDKECTLHNVSSCSGCYFEKRTATSICDDCIAYEYYHKE